MRKIVLLGSTGSIGTQTLDVVRNNSKELEVVGLAANTRVNEVETLTVSPSITPIKPSDGTFS